MAQLPKGGNLQGAIDKPMHGSWAIYFPGCLSFPGLVPCWYLPTRTGDLTGFLNHQSSILLGASDGVLGHNFPSQKCMDQKDHNKDTLQETNISPKNGILNRWFSELPVWWDMWSIPWRVASPSLGSLLFKINGRLCRCQQLPQRRFGGSTAGWGSWASWCD